MGLRSHPTLLRDGCVIKEWRSVVEGVQKFIIKISVSYNTCLVILRVFAVVLIAALISMSYFPDLCILR